MTSLDGRRILVTGANGFIGSHLAAALVEAGARVRTLSFYNEQRSPGWLEDLEADHLASIDNRFGDVRDSGFVDQIVDGCDIVMHLAALVSIPYSYEAPRSFVETNVTGTLNVLEAVRHRPETRLVHTSTSEVYGTPDTVPIRETHPLRAQSPYSASKVAADKLCESYARSFDVEVTVLRPFNTYGPRQSLRAVIPTILGQLLAGTSEVELGSLAPLRDFTYVSDTVAGFLAMAERRLDPGTVVQLGSGRAISIGELFRLCADIVGSDAEVTSASERVRPAASEVHHLESDPTQAAQLLDWRPIVPLEDGLARTVDWLRGRVPDLRTGEYHR